jgi:hypothetical protein
VDGGPEGRRDLAGVIAVSDANPRANYHVLLVGVDAYTSRPLGGCVNDIDAMQRVLLGPRMRLAPDRIRRLASPRPGETHETTIAEQPATLDNLRGALAELSSERVAPGDRVFIYYAGHGARVEGSGPGGQWFHREALVPVDCDEQANEPRLLYDFELNELLRKILARTRSVAVVLDCCHAAGATRSALAPDDWRPRFLELPRGGPRGGSLPDPRRGAPPVVERRERLAVSVEDCHVVSACLAHERAQEGSGPDGVRNGLFTRALLAALDAAADVELSAVTWGRIWHALYAGVQQRNPGQHVSMIGNAGREVFGGLPKDGDAGIPVSRSKAGYRIAAGTLAGITPGATLAIYGERPRRFPQLGSNEDREARTGLLEVTAAERATAVATAIGRPFELPPGARARPVAAGEHERLRCAMIPRDPTVESWLARSRLLELVKDPVQAEVRLEHRDGWWFVTDSMHGVGRDAPVLFALKPAELDCARDVLEHYYRYARPLQVAARATDLPGSLTLRVLRCPERKLSAAEAQAGALPEVPSRAERSYLVSSGTQVCFQVENHSAERLRITLLNSAGSGKVQLLGDEIVDAGATHVFWADGALGEPFHMTPPDWADRCIDRLVAIGRTAVEHDLRYLEADQTFLEVVQVRRGAGGATGVVRRPPSLLEHWTAIQVIVETRRWRGPPT